MEDQCDERDRGGLSREAAGTPLARRVWLAVGLQAVQQLAGINTVMYFAGKIFQRAGFGAGNAVRLTAAAGGANFVGTLLGVALVDRVGRRPLLMCSLGGVTLCLLCLAGMLWAGGGGAGGDGGGQSGSGDGGQTWLAPSVLAAVVGYLLAFAPGLGALPWTIQSEMFRGRRRASAVAVATATNWGCNFVVSLTFLPLARALDGWGAFAMYAACAGLGGAMFWVYLPETSSAPGRKGSGVSSAKSQVRGQTWSREDPDDVIIGMH